MASTEVIGIIRPDRTIRTEGVPFGKPWMCKAGHTQSYDAVSVGTKVGLGYPCATCETGFAMSPQKEERTTVSEMILPQDSATRKESPITTGFLDYFPLAAAAVARLSKKGNDKHNPGQPLHWSREKSQDHADCIPRHLIDRGITDPDTNETHTVSLAWRALALLELEEEQRLGKGVSRGSK